MIDTKGPVQPYVFCPDNKSLNTVAADRSAVNLLLKTHVIGLPTQEGLGGSFVYVTVT